jgi:hypothetical protein
MKIFTVRPTRAYAGEARIFAVRVTDNGGATMTVRLEILGTFRRTDRFLRRQSSHRRSDERAIDGLLPSGAKHGRRVMLPDRKPSRV